MKTTTNIIYPAFALFVLACFSLSPHARATCQDACLRNSNTVQGDDALLTNNGFSNTAIGFEALFSNTIGNENTATGAYALQFSTISNSNTATGAYALSLNTIGAGNTATGDGALYSNTIGNFNTASGNAALFFNITGNENTASGSGALAYNATGRRNTATGRDALFFNTTGNGNIALGFNAGLNLTTGSDNIDIGNAGVANESNKIRIGTNGIHTNTFIAGISGVTVADGVGVIIDARGHLGTVVSSERFKDEVKPMDKASEAILALRPVTFHYKKDLDPEGIPQFGLVAEQVERVNPDLVARDEQGKPYTVRYEAVNAMLLNEFLKEHRRNEEQENRIADQQKEIEKLAATVKAQAIRIEKVSEQLALDRPVAQRSL